MGMGRARRDKRKRKRFEKLRANWSWWDSIVGVIVGFFVGAVLTMLYLESHWEAVTLLKEYSAKIIELFLIAFLLGRMFSVARWPRKPALDYNKITWGGVVAANFLTIIMGFMLIIITLALVAPGVLELLAEHFGD